MILTCVLISSLCQYLIARYARKSWIHCKKLPHYICLYIFLITIVDVSYFFCYLTFISNCLQWLFGAIMFAITTIQFNRFIAEINRKNKDLENIKDYEIRLRNLKMSKNRCILCMKLLSTGIVLFILAELLSNIFIGTELILHGIYKQNFLRKSSFCKVHQGNIPLPIFVTISSLNTIITVIGFMFVLGPYLVIGYQTMFILIWRRITGKTGVKIRYNNHLTKKLLYKK